MAGGQSWLSGGGFDWWSPGVLGSLASSDEARSSGEGEGQTGGNPGVDPSEWLRVEAAVVLGTLRPVPPLRMMKLSVECALLWVDVAHRPEVEDLGRVLANEGAGEASCYWMHAQGREGERVCLLTIVLRRPVRTAFAVPFSFQETQRLLTGILRARSLVLCFGSPPEGMSEAEPMVNVLALYELATTPSRETISIEFDWAAQHELQRKLLQWASMGLWDA